MANDLGCKYQEVVNYLKRHKTAKVTELSQVFFLSESTVRRILAQLERDGLVRRFHGGAVLRAPDLLSDVVRRQVANQPEKSAIGQLAASFVQDGMSVLMLGGTTVCAVCPYLLGGPKITVVTNSILVINELCWEKNIRIIQMGGILNPWEMEARGVLARQALERLRTDLMFIGATGIHPQHGLMTEDLEAVDTYRACFAASDSSFILADHTKFSITKQSVVVPLSEMEHIVTDSGIPVDVRMHYEAQGIQMHVAFREVKEE